MEGGHLPVDEEIAFDARASQRVYILREKRRGVTYLWVKKSSVLVPQCDKIE